VAIEGNNCRHSRGQRSPRSVDRSIAALAGRQHGVVARRQLAALGLGADAIDHRIAAGRLHPIHRGVYAVGHRSLTRHAVWIAAVLAAGADAVLSHRSAAALWGIRHGERSSVEVIAPRRIRERRGLHAYRIVLPPDEVTHERGIPVTNVARTLLDLAAVVSQEQLEHALNEAEIRRLTSPLPLDALVARYPGRRGIAAINRALGNQRQTGETITRSELERRFLAFTEAHGLPRPQTNTALGPYEPDALWPDARLVVELDSYAIHTTRQAFESDRARDRALQTMGYRVVRITWRQLRTDPHAIAGQLRALLAIAGPRPR
jgi:very-short-patch-repair endonuclease/predicted transcriptional regulator of viral defense system